MIPASHELKIFFPFFKCSFANIVCRILRIYLVVHSVVFLLNTFMVLCYFFGSGGK